MKFTLLKLSICAVASILSLTSNATIRTVNNNPNSPGQYTNLTDAIAASADGDTLMIAGSNTDYGDITLSKSLTLIGTGYYPRKDVTLISKIGTIGLSPGTSNNSVFIGLYFTNSFNGDGSVINGISIRKSYITSGCYFNSVSNVNIIDCIINGDLYVVNCNNFLIANNILNGFIDDQGSSPTNVIAKNNLFTGTRIGGGIHNVLFNNNIFYYRSSSTNNNELCTDCTNNVFNNNIYYNQTANALPIGANNNTGTANISANPQFNQVNTNSDFSTVFFDDYNLQSGSPAINYGTDGKDVGLYGGTFPIDYPLAGEPPIPQIKSMTINNNIVPPGGTLNVEVKARKAH